MARQPNAAATSAFPGPPQIPYCPPVTPSISPTIAHLIPRLRTAINDIDIFQQMVAQGVIDNSMPNWDSILRQYTLLTGRLNALSTYLTSTSQTPDDPTHLSLLQQIITPLNPLPAGSNALAHEAYFQGLNTMPLMDVQNHTSSLLGSTPWKDSTELRGLSQSDLEAFSQRIRKRLNEENAIGEGLSELVKAQSEEYEWDKRVQEEGEAGEDDDDDLFNDKEDMAEEKQNEDEPELAPNPRPGWTLADYVGYMDAGVRPSRIGV